MKKVEIGIWQCNDCPHYRTVFVHGPLFNTVGKECYLTGENPPRGDEIPKDCPLPEWSEVEGGRG